MKLRGIEFGNVLGASGVQGFFGEGYWFHRPWKPFGLDFSGMGFVSKTATWDPRAGNMPLNYDFTPERMFPPCVRAQFGRGVMLNAVGLSNPGLYKLVRALQWQKRTEPFFISIMTVAETREKRMKELAEMMMFLGLCKETFHAPFGLQINLSCPNTGHSAAALIAEAEEAITIAGSLGVPVVPKFSIATAPIDAVLYLNDLSDCDAICVSNTIPFGWQHIDWKQVWGSDVSPLKDLGGGGLSGSPLRPLVCDWIRTLRSRGFTKPIHGGGGIMSVADVDHYFDAGASSVFLGSVAVLRPWRVRSIISQANNLHWG